MKTKFSHLVNLSRESNDIRENDDNLFQVKGKHNRNVDCLSFQNMELHAWIEF